MMISYGELDCPEPDQHLDHGSPLQVIGSGLPPEAPQINITLPPHLVPVLDQLLRAPTDIAASRMLDISQRTFSRRVAELLEYLGVQTRFQGGVTVALSGWVRTAQDDDQGNGTERRTQ
jgi:hypothetical protein